MDENFFSQLDEALTSVGADKYWERKIGDHTVWLSPVPFNSQHKINELLTNESLGSNVIAEIKRTTISYAIVGFDGFDLRPYRNETPQFPVFDHREKKSVKVALHKYLYTKMGEWGTEWVDSAFAVFSDILESIRKENLKEVKFENAKDQREELAELEEKVHELRFELGMPSLVEMKDEDEEKPEKKPREKPEEKNEVEEEPAFNPFRKLPTSAPEAVPVNVPARVPSVPSVPSVPTAEAFAKSLPIEGSTSSPDKPYVVGQNSDVIERRPVKESNLAIQIDPVHQSVNPRFKSG
jgi:hypothetical protein